MPLSIVNCLVESTVEKESNDGGVGDFATGGAVVGEPLDEALGDDRLVAAGCAQQPNVWLILVGIVAEAKIEV